MANLGSRSVNQSKNGKAHEARRKTSNRRLALYFLFVILTTLPLILPLIGTWADPVHDFSIYNTDWNGASEFRAAIENDGYETGTLISSLSALNKMTDPGVLINGHRVFGDFNLGNEAGGFKKPLIILLTFYQALLIILHHRDIY